MDTTRGAYCYHADINIASINLKPYEKGEYKETVEVDLPAGTLLVDLNQAGEVIGFEFLNAEGTLPEAVREAMTQETFSISDKHSHE